VSAGRAVATIDLGAIRHNAAVLDQAAGEALLMAVVKAGGYGHGAVPVARAALEGGADQLGVVTVEEADELRAAGLPAPILVMGPLLGEELERAVEGGYDVTAWTPELLEAADAIGRRRGAPVPVHLKLDTGMGRLGVRPEDVDELALAADRAGLRVAGLMTHFATADEREGPNAGFMREQLLRFRARVGALRERFPDAVAHAANSAATLRDRESAFDMVRCGIALYGGSPFGTDPDADDLRPALALRSFVASVKTLRSRDSAGYGRLYRAPRATRIAVVPIGYGDGWTRSSTGGRVLVDGTPAAIVGAVSMDQITVELGPEGAARVGDEVTLIGVAGDERITIEEIAAHRGTINYEVTCALGARVRRVYEG
jgi:alanine racemase